MDSAHHHHQEMGSQTLESILVCPKTQQQEKKPRPADQQALKCPRCDSTNTKFCYYNNYSLSQPRYFCKSCRRYWTKGGTLRNVPVGGGCRRNKRSSSSTSSASSSSSSSKRAQDHHHQSMSAAIPSPNIPYDSSDLSLAIARLQKQAASGGQLGLSSEPEFPIWGGNPNNQMPDFLGTNPGMFEAIRSGFLEAPQNTGFQNLYYGMENGIMGMSGSQEIGGFPYEGFNTVKQEVCNGETKSSSVLWGFPWQQNGDGNMAEFDHQGNTSSSSNSRLGWNGIGSSPSWHGLLNSPLM